MTPKKEKQKQKKKKKKETREFLTQKPIWSKMKGKAHCSKCTLHVHCIFGNARRNEIISTEELAKKLWAIVW